MKKFIQITHDEGGIREGQPILVAVDEIITIRPSTFDDCCIIQLKTRYDRISVLENFDTVLSRLREFI